MNNVPSPVPSRRRGFSLIEVTLAIGILGLAIPVSYTHLTLPTKA